ncbi:hypothetical protein, partial [Enhygromyxa salina]|uniref:hypothetical protein n=1 Tax=Enhygromyxa salina TaxID=215803 RepID=UPI0015E5B923
MGTTEDLDEPTEPFTHTQIGRMLNVAERGGAARERVVDLAYFEEFGQVGTPRGMIGSRKLAVVSGCCGDAPLEGGGQDEGRDPYPWGPAPTELGGGGPQG